MPPAKNNTPDLSEFRFDIDASIVFQLGENLITSVVQAVVELVKNAYDADASYCRLEVATKNRAGDLSRSYSGAKGVVVIEDDGHGMTPEVIQNGFLVISNSLKREMKSKNQTTKRGRTPLGDKGLGRLSAQRLADNVEIFTKPAGSDTEYYIGFSWKDFVDQERLSHVKLKTDAWQSTRKQGTRLILSGLREPEAWQDEDSISELQEDLSRMISPYKEILDFTLVGTIDGVKLELREFAEKLRETAQLRYKVDFDEKRIHFVGKAKLDYLYPDHKEDKKLFQQTVMQDDGKAFLKFLCSLKGADRFDVRPSSDKGWFVEYEYNRNFDEVDKLKLVNGKRANPGPFKGEIDGYDLGGFVAAKVAKDEFSIFDSDKEYRDTIKMISGIRVYRDGFGIRVDRDWLGLGKQWTSGTSYYTLRPENTIGYIAISARDNKQLEETTDREGFRATPYYENFVRLMQEFVRFSADAQEFVRRGWLRFRDAERKKETRVDPDAPPETVSDQAHRKISKAESVKGSLSSAKSAITQTTGSKAQLKKKLQTVEAAITSTEKFIDDVSSVKKDLEYMDLQIRLLKEQMAQMYETVSLGITAEALSHEIKNITDNLAGRNRKLSKYLQEKQIKDAQIVAHVEHINTAVGGLRKQLSHLAPSLRFVREKREVISLPEFCNGIPDFYKGRMERANIELIIEPSKGRKFEISINLGKLNQIFDNLILNSEYWIKEDLRLGQIEAGELHIQLDKPYLRIWDNARGFDRAIETSLFTQPFITTKGAGKGRGLGLFIVQQLLDAERCTIELLPKKNKKGNRYVLEIDFTGALNV